AGYPAIARVTHGMAQVGKATCGRRIMPLQTVQDLIGLLELLQQPAFCLRQDGQVFSNRLAETLSPAGGLCLDEWLGACRDAYRGWNRTGGLSLTLPI